MATNDTEPPDTEPAPASKPYTFTLDHSDRAALLHVPQHLREGLRLYVEQGVEPGSFLCACIDNDLRMAIAMADDEVAQKIGAVVTWLHNHAPGTCWGSKDNRIAWCRRFQAKSRAA